MGRPQGQRRVRKRGTLAGPTFPEVGLCAQPWLEPTPSLRPSEGGPTGHLEEEEHVGGAANPSATGPLPWAQFLCGGAPPPLHPPSPIPPAEQFPYYKHLQMPSVCKYFHLQARCLMFTGHLLCARPPPKGTALPTQRRWPELR